MNDRFIFHYHSKYLCHNFFHLLHFLHFFHLSMVSKQEFDDHLNRYIIPLKIFLKNIFSLQNTSCCGLKQQVFTLSKCPSRV